MNFGQKFGNSQKLLVTSKVKVIIIMMILLNVSFLKIVKLTMLENCLTKKDETDALIFYSENNSSRSVSWKELQKSF